MAISRKYKRHVKMAYENSSDVTRAKRTWSFHVGDLVEIDDDHGIILKEDQESGHFWVCGPRINRWIKAVKLKTVQGCMQNDAS